MHGHTNIKLPWMVEFHSVTGDISATIGKVISMLFRQRCEVWGFRGGEDTHCNPVRNETSGRWKPGFQGNMM